MIIDELVVLHAFLPAIIKFSLIILICLLAYVPIALISWILFVAFGKALQKLIFFCEEVSARFFDLSKRCSARSKRLMTNFYSKYTTVISFDNPKYQLTGHPVQQSLDNFDSELKMAPAVASDNETKKSRPCPPTHSISR
jgi:Na+/pantothenate symporter